MLQLTPTRTTSALFTTTVCTIGLLVASHAWATPDPTPHSATTSAQPTTTTLQLDSPTTTESKVLEAQAGASVPPEYLADAVTVPRRIEIGSAFEMVIQCHNRETTLVNVFGLIGPDPNSTQSILLPSDDPLSLNEQQVEEPNGGRFVFHFEAGTVARTIWLIVLCNRESTCSDVLSAPCLLYPLDKVWRVDIVEPGDLLEIPPTL